MVSQIIAKVAGSLASKFGVSRQQAERIAASLIPAVMNQFINKTNNPSDNDFDLQDIMKNVTGNGNFDSAAFLAQAKPKTCSVG
jgi:hypothetical protein